MIGWRHQIDPQFFVKEAALLRVQTAGLAGYDSGRSTVQRIAADRTIRRALIAAGFLAFLAATGFGALQAAGDWAAVVALALLTVLSCWRAPWWLPPPTGAPPNRRAWQPVALAATLVVVPAVLRGLPNPLEATLAAAIAAAAAAAFVPASSGAKVGTLPRRLRFTAAFALFGAGLVQLASTRYAEEAFVVAGLAAGVAMLAIVGMSRPWRGVLSAVDLASRLCALLLVAALFAGGGTLVAWYVGLAAIVLAAGALEPAARRLALAPPWSIYTALAAVHLWSAAVAPAGITAWLPTELACVATEYLLVCFIAVRCAKAASDSRPVAYRQTYPQTVVPLLDRSSHEALGSWLA
jgi:hypothetical protein